MRAVVFVRRTGADGAGHVGWAFDCGDGTFNVGSIENPHHTLRTLPDQMGFWVVKERDPIEPMRQRAYTHFKLIEVGDSHPTFARQVVAWLGARPYDLFGHNCMNATYDVLRAFGAAPLPAPARHWEPNHWFNHIRGREYRIDTQNVSFERQSGRRSVDLFSMPDAASLSDEPPSEIVPAQPSWRTPETPEWRALQHEMAAAPPMPPGARRQHRSRRLLSHIWRWLGQGLHSSARR